MSKFNTTATRPANTATGPIGTKKNKTVDTHEGAAGFKRDKRSELFLLAVSNFVGENTFYESADARDNRYQKLIREMAVKDPEWTADMLAWLRGPEANMRSASLVGAAEYVKARLDKGLHGDNRKVINSVLQRADEPGEMLAYWTSNYGRRIPQPVKRGVADAVVRLYNERSLLKYDTSSKGFRFGDVIDLTHPSADDGKAWQGDLFEYALDRRHNRDKPIPESLKTIQNNEAFKHSPAKIIDYLADNGTLAEVLGESGMTWEQLSGFGPMTAARWEAMIPTMGIMAQIRNLRNFDEAGVSDQAAQLVIDNLTDPIVIEKSRQFPFRFLSAYEHAPSLRWGHALDKALGHSLRNIPELPGKTLILVDTSGSMQSSYNARSTMAPVKAAAVFGVALGVKNGANADIYGFASGEFHHSVKRGASTLTEINRFINRVGEKGHGTDIAGAVARQYRGHDRVCILSDMQSCTGNITAPVPAHVPVYGFNLQGYAPAAMRLGPNRHEFGSLTDATFKLIPQLEAAESGNWPWVK
ncbi:TROVE domain-containing protein [Nocardia jiangxiensis]|uniref:TROVE domain-containing protein n=1 Tax=Nocardia jiangxiensis TaxID=282685 RepID=UPI00031FC0A9|nr:TROVE domain-containing protein [Nocardia jiangxiensis]